MGQTLFNLAEKSFEKTIIFGELSQDKALSLALLMSPASQLVHAPPALNGLKGMSLSEKILDSFLLLQLFQAVKKKIYLYKINLLLVNLLINSGWGPPLDHLPQFIRIPSHQ